VSHERDETAPNFYKGYEDWKKWSKPFSFHAEEAKYFAGELRGISLKGASLLEIGFGSGSFLAWAKMLGAEVSGVEINEAMLAEARKNDVTILPATFEAIADQHKSGFDVIVGFDVFEHFDLETVAMRLKACEKMLRAGGHLVLRFPNGQSPFGMVSQKGDVTHRSALSKAAITQILGVSDLSVLRYGPSFRVRGGPPMTAAVRFVRYGMRSLLSVVLNFIYNQTIPWDAVVTIVLQKQPR
jgi:2-polyprenyl-3-methyl-5-hydroxy-6-metoxy-1,4-benzoquinol methylase